MEHPVFVALLKSGSWVIAGARWGMMWGLSEGDMWQTLFLLSLEQTIDAGLPGAVNPRRMVTDHAFRMENEHDLCNVLGGVDGQGFNLSFWEPVCADFFLLDQGPTNLWQREPYHIRQRLTSIKLEEILNTRRQYFHSNYNH